MTSREPVCQQLIRPEQVGEVGPAEAPAEQASTTLLDRPRVVAEALVANVEPAARDPELTVAGHPRRQHGVEQVNAAMDRLEQVRGRAEAHQVAVARIPVELEDHEVQDSLALGGRLVAGQAADVEAVEREPRDERGGLPPEGRVKPAGYFVFRGGEFLAAVSALSYDDVSAWVRPGLGCVYAVQSCDRAGNMSAPAAAVVQTPDKRPDLICTGVAFPLVKPGDSVAFQGTVKNIGDGPTPQATSVALTFFVDGKYTSYGATDGTPLAPGESRPLTADGGANGGHWIAVPGAHILSVQVDDTDRVSDESSKENNFVDRSLLVAVPAAGELLGAGDPAPGQADLTAEGTSDWIQWGLGDKAAVNRKAGGGSQISGVTELGTGYLDATSGFGMSAHWSDGTPAAAENDTHSSLWLNGVGHGFRFSAPADTQERTLRVYVGAINGAAGALTAHLSDGSAPDYLSTTFNGNRAPPWSPVPAGFTVVYTLRYRAASPHQTLVVTWTLAGEPNSFSGQARLQAATLALSSP